MMVGGVVVLEQKVAANIKLPVFCIKFGVAHYTGTRWSQQPFKQANRS